MTMFVAYIGLVVLPFFAYGVHLQPPDEVAFGMFDPKGFPLYSEQIFAGYIHLTGMLVVVIAPIASVVLSGALVLTLVRRWRGMSDTDRRIYVAVAIICAAFALFTFSPLGRLIMVWQLD